MLLWTLPALPHLLTRAAGSWWRLLSSACSPRCLRAQSPAQPPTPNLPASTLMWGSGSQWGCSSDLALGLTSVWKPGGTARSVKSHEKSDSLPSPRICRGFSCFHNTFPACDLRRCSQPTLPEKKAKTNEMTCPRPEPELRTFSTKSRWFPASPPLSLPPLSSFSFFFTQIFMWRRRGIGEESKWV